jgi:hypothetical protein
MDSPACHVIYVNRSVGQERLVQAKPDGTIASGTLDSEQDVVRQEIQPLLEAFGDGMFCSLRRKGGDNFPSRPVTLL